MNVWTVRQKMTQLWRGGRQWRFHCKSTIENVVFSVSDTGGSKINNLSSPSRSWTYDRLVTSPGALPLSHRRLVGAKATKVQFWGKNVMKNAPCVSNFRILPSKARLTQDISSSPPPQKKINVKVWLEQFCSDLTLLTRKGGRGVIMVPNS